MDFNKKGTYKKKLTHVSAENYIRKRYNERPRFHKKVFSLIVNSWQTEHSDLRDKTMYLSYPFLITHKLIIHCHREK